MALTTEARPLEALIQEIWTDRIGEPEFGVWCAICALPSAVRIRIAWGPSMTLMAEAFEVVACLDCCSRTIVPSPLEV